MERVATGQLLGDREKQEDAVRIARQSEDGENSDLLMLLSDGMGGHAGGEIASNLALETFQDHFENVSTNMRPRGRLEESLEAANAAIAAEAVKNPELKGMGCTLIAVLVAAGRLVWVSVGDSVLFLMRHGQLRRLNADHSYFGELLELVERGEITRQEAAAHPKKNALLSVLTGAPIKLVDLNVIESDPGDVLILASDGLETLSDEDIGRIAQATIGKGVSAVSEALLAAVNTRARPRQDNTSVVVMQYAPEGLSGFSSGTKWNMQPDQVEKANWSKHLLIGGAVAGALAVGILVGWMFKSEAPEPVVEDALPEAIAPSGPVDIQDGDGTTIDDAPTDGTTPPNAPDFEASDEEARETPAVPDSEGIENPPASSSKNDGVLLTPDQKSALGEGAKEGSAGEEGN